METTNDLPNAAPPGWARRLVGLLPLVMLTLTWFSAPNRLLPGELAPVLFFGSIPVAALLILTGWMPAGLALYLPVIWLVQVVIDEVPPDYDMSFTLVLSGILLVGALGYLFSPSRKVGWLFMIGAAVVAYFLAGATARRFWGVFCTDTFDACLRCVENFAVCKPEIQQAYPWWRFVLGR